MSSTAALAAPDVRVILGPTAAGKTALALRLAATRPVTILSADSRQVYRGFDLGTAKPTRAERDAVPHRGIDVADPRERFSAYRWADLAEDWIAEARSAGREPLVVGGTGFYVRALCMSGWEEPPLDPGRRAVLGEWLAGLALAELRRWATTLDPARAHLGRTQLLRAIEVALLTGERLSVLHERLARPPRVRARYLVVDPGAALAGRIAARAGAMLDGGWAEEVRALSGQVPAGAPAWNASGYGAVRALVEGRATREETLQRIVIETRQYAKRQRTWFRHQLGDGPVLRVNPDDPAAWDLVERWWNDAEEGT